MHTRNVLKSGKSCQSISGSKGLVARRGCVLSSAGQARSRDMQVHVGDFLKSLFDFESWAPKSTRVWRLQQYQPPNAAQTNSPGAPDSMAILSDRINQLRDQPSSSSNNSSRGGSSSSNGSLSVIDPADQPSSHVSGSMEWLDGSSAGADKSFSDADDDEVAIGLNKRIGQIATKTGQYGSSTAEDELRQHLTGEELRQLLLTKYSKCYDVSIVRRDVPGMKTFICLNIMWLHLEQQSFRMTPGQYMEKLEGVAALVNILGQTDKVRAFLRTPARSQKGLPRRPVVGTAISIRFDLEQAIVDEWFGSGYD